MRLVTQLSADMRAQTMSRAAGLDVLRAEVGEQLGNAVRVDHGADAPLGASPHQQLGLGLAQVLQKEA